VDKLLICFSVPFFASKEKLVAVEDSSLTTNRNFPFGENAAWRGPEPAFSLPTPAGAAPAFPSRHQIGKSEFHRDPDPREREMIVRAGFNPMRVRTFLPLLFARACRCLE